jgi:hypothetical protein
VIEICGPLFSPGSVFIIYRKPASNSSFEIGILYSTFVL